MEDGHGKVAGGEIVEIDMIAEEAYKLLKLYSMTELKPNEKIAIFNSAAKTIESILISESLAASLYRALQK